MASLRILWAFAPLGVGLALAFPASADLAAAEAAIAAKKYDTAIAELQPLVSAGDGYAKWKLAQLYLAGHGGSAAEGVSLLQEAAEAGEPEAQSRLGVLYAKGEGVPQSDTEAYKWLSLASRGAAPGVSRIMAQTNQTVVGQRMTPAQRATAETESSQAAAGYQAPAAATAVEPVATAEAPVAAEPAETQVASLPATDAPSGIRLQLASVANEADVDGEWKRLRKRLGAALDGQQLQIERADLGTKGIFYRLQIGPFADRSAAKAACKDINAAGGDCLLVAN
ncbi:SPOR domain-containing protein [Dongia rigui]|uniref:SPOR domain-containing protein n=1 Tax=Dongia rigui TaxID=940149 RepID=A0ABU5E1S0_9PROT|nr:SPOR domain-containing protein [Dongia rigui]MDY0872761.1 SPOR domain-containing protein [Dongia rigui]